MSNPIQDLKKAVAAYDEARSHLGITRCALAEMRSEVHELEKDLVEAGVEVQEAYRTLKAAEAALDELHGVEA